MLVGECSGQSHLSPLKVLRFPVEVTAGTQRSLTECQEVGLCLPPGEIQTLEVKDERQCEKMKPLYWFLVPFH
jgi:hypothetical protein